MDDIEPPRPALAGTPPQQPVRRPAPAAKPATQHRAIRHPQSQEDEPFLPIRKEKKKRGFWRYLIMLIFAILLLAVGFAIGHNEKILPDLILPWEESLEERPPT